MKNKKYLKIGIMIFFLFVGIATMFFEETEPMAWFLIPFSATGLAISLGELK